VSRWGKQGKCAVRGGTHTILYYYYVHHTHSVRRQYSVMVVLLTGMAVCTFDRSPSRVVRFRFAAAVCVAVFVLLARTTAADAAESSSSGCAPKVKITNNRKTRKPLFDLPPPAECYGRQTFLVDDDRFADVVDHHCRAPDVYYIMISHSKILL